MPIVVNQYLPLASCSLCALYFPGMCCVLLEWLVAFLWALLVPPCCIQRLLRLAPAWFALTLCLNFAHVFNCRSCSFSFCVSIARDAHALPVECWAQCMPTSADKTTSTSKFHVVSSVARSFPALVCSCGQCNCCCSNCPPLLTILYTHPH